MRQIALLFLLCLCCVPAFTAPSVVTIKKVNDGYELVRNGAPYLIKGAGAEDHFELLKNEGGNSIRTWSTKNLGETLDRAHALGLTVTAGIWLGHERHGFDYTNADAVAKQLQEALQAVETHKHHPALLMWGVGNEMEGGGNNRLIWQAVDQLARKIKEIDPNHPTITVIAELGSAKVSNFKKYCPSVDALGVNSYGGVASLSKRLKKAGLVRPYVVTEFGPPGQWESRATAWKTKHELTSTQKARLYGKAYRGAILDKPNCLGSYAFVWGAKQEATATWFGMLLPDGTRLEAVDTLRELWGASAPANRCPQIQSARASKTSGIAIGETITVSIAATDPEGDTLTAEWQLVRDSHAYGTGGDAEYAPQPITEAILESNASTASIRIPHSGGAYRIYVYLRDGHGGGATASIPIHVSGKTVAEPPPKASIPFTLYDKAGSGSPFNPAGYMGDQGAITMHTGCREHVDTGDTCIKVAFAKPSGWGGVTWQSPAQDWGDRPGGLDFTGATHLSFRARGDQGSEKITFGIGLIGEDKPHHDSAREKLANLVLTTEWQTFHLSLEGKDLSSIKTPFYWTAGAAGQPFVFYLDDIRIHKK